jgi:shikimate kinase
MEHPAPTAVPAARHIVLVGLMASGKTTVGRLLAALLGRPLRDSDAEIEAREGRTVREIREALGTAALHDLEARVLLDALASPGPDVITAAGSTAERDECLAALRGLGVSVVWLRVRPETGAARFRAGAHRPWYGDDPVVFLARQAAVRGPRLASVATLVLDADDRAPDDLADAILVALAGWGGATP